MSTRITAEKKRKITALDFLLVILIVALITTTVVTIIKGDPKNSASGNKNISYTITLTMLSKDIADGLKSGDIIYHCDTNQNLGTVDLVEITPIKATDKNDGSEIELSDKVNVNLIIKTSVFEDESSLSIGSYRLMVGNTVNFKSETYILAGTCTAINL